MNFLVCRFLGAPQVLRQSATPEVVVEKGQSADLSMVVCADPRPRFVAWEWGSLRLEAGSEMGEKTNSFWLLIVMETIRSLNFPRWRFPVLYLTVNLNETIKKQHKYGGWNAARTENLCRTNKSNKKETIWPGIKLATVICLFGGPVKNKNSYRRRRHQTGTGAYFVILLLLICKGMHFYRVVHERFETGFNGGA